MSADKRDVERAIVVRNWDRFQHADVTRSVVPPWIKNYTRLMSDDNYLSLSGHRRAILHGLWLEYARSRGELRDNTLRLSRRLSLKVSRRDLEALNHAGFIEFLQAPLDASTSRAHREVEVEVEKNYDVRKEARPEERDDENLSTIDYEDLLKTITGVE